MTVATTELSRGLQRKLFFADQLTVLMQTEKSHVCAARHAQVTKDLLHDLMVLVGNVLTWLQRAQVPNIDEDEFDARMIHGRQQEASP